MGNFVDVLVDIVANSPVLFCFFLWMTLSLCLNAWQHLADSFHSILEKSNLQESKISSLLSGTKLHSERKTKSSWQNTMWRSHLVDSSGYYRAGSVLIVIWWLRMEGDCCFFLQLSKVTHNQWFNISVSPHGFCTDLYQLQNDLWYYK